MLTAFIIVFHIQNNNFYTKHNFNKDGAIKIKLNPIIATK